MSSRLHRPFTRPVTTRSQRMSTACIARMIVTTGETTSPSRQPNAPCDLAHSSGRVKKVKMEKRISSTIPVTPARRPGQNPRTRESPQRFTLCVATLKREKRHARRHSVGKTNRCTRAYTSSDTLRRQPLSRYRAARASGGDKSNDTSHNMLCAGSDERKWSRPAATPSSAAIPRATSAARAMTSGAHSSSIFSIRLSTVSWLIGHGAGPTPAL
mmetsp:Transcript_15583/g.47352  ORF Transcript_15583/g.47352 Transcript_15583/m.47352 type:complete len:214 (-) Transcript_15583:1011-1652(-)|eukprot:scaffold195286_cov30-Tisochrysis_lutea.AAC.2